AATRRSRGVESKRRSSRSPASTLDSGSTPGSSSRQFRAPSEGALSLTPESSSDLLQDPAISYVSPEGHDRAAALDDERNRLIAALDSCAGNQTRAAKMLGISRRQLIARIEFWQLPRPKKR
ncbi:MAG TPA: helix-turn-helix domain-containing protein, partial [Polyangiaceae bacterium]|nr:helix-turn-helix domain-containing protein [Polyangiaceae bacterium]